MKTALPDRRFSEQQKVKIGGRSVFITCGDYPDGRLGEFFLDLDKEGATLRAMANCFAMSVSTGLQHGVPLAEYVDLFLFSKFEPAGMVQGHPEIASCASIIDYLFRHLAIKYLDRKDLNQKSGDGATANG